ncbi:VWA domain-containing protein [Cereibacter sphaeroides]|nr:VWA domain-containing protein [Cereibacter sphaeroides]
MCLVLDTSASMTGAPITELQEGVSTFFAQLLADDVAEYSAEVAVVTFGGNVDMAVDFAAVTRQTVPSLTAGGMTPMGEAVETALELLHTRKEEYKRAGVDYYQPWLVIMTDGAPTDNISKASRLVDDLVREKKLAVFAIGIGKDADMNELAKLSGGRPPLKLKGLEFGQFFLWLSASVGRVSQSVPGNKVDLDPVAAWASV